MTSPKPRRIAVLVPVTRLALSGASALLALGSAWASVASAQVDQPSAPTDPPPAGPAYVLSAPDDPSSLTLTTLAGRWAIELDQQTCGPSVIPPASNVIVDLLDTPTGVEAAVQPMVIRQDGEIMPGQPLCEVQQALFAASEPCAQIDDHCDIAAETQDGAGEP